MKNKLSRIASAIVFLTLLLVFALSLAPSVGAAREAGGTGVWAEVCCGSHCSPGDYCIGSGTFTCCKGIAAE